MEGAALRLPAVDVDQTLENFFNPMVDALEGIVFFAVPIGGAQLPILVVWLLGSAFAITLIVGFRPWRDLVHSIQIIRGHYNRYDDPGQVTSFQALATERDGLAQRGMPRLGKALAVAFSIFAMIGALGAGNVFQANQLAAQVVVATGGQDSVLAGLGWLIGIVVAAITGAVILGGITSIANWTSRLTPLMGLLYLGCILVIFAVNFTSMPAAILAIFQGAFTGEGVKGGIIGVAIVGIQRALFSNAAGVGTAAIAHSVTKTRRPAQEGFVAAWEPFIDSVVICTMTALAVIVTGQNVNLSGDGVAITTAVFATVNTAFTHLLTVCVVLFAFSTILSYSYYGMKATGYLFGDSRIAELVYNIFWLIMIVVGAAVSLNTVVRFSDAMFFLMAVPNLLGIFLLSKVLRHELVGHRHALREGRIEVVPEAERSTMLNKPMKGVSMRS
ncbi:MAG: alanine:cation symporter family protein [Micrococcales bacterium]|nr:alanine:cation symporter family protein [Micrococcales bacterium]